MPNLSEDQFKPWTQHDVCPVPDIARPSDRYNCACGKSYEAIQQPRKKTLKWAPADAPTS